jgi:hypothetical protein
MYISPRLERRDSRLAASLLPAPFPLRELTYLHDVLALIYHPFLSLSCWCFSTMLLCRLFPLPPASATSPLGRAWLLIDFSLLDLSSSVRSTSLCALPSYPSDSSMSTPPFVPDSSLQLWFDFVLFFFLHFFLTFFFLENVKGSPRRFS